MDFTLLIHVLEGILYFKKLQKFKVDAVDEKRTLFLFWLDTIIKDAANNHVESIAGTEVKFCNNTEKPNGPSLNPEHENCPKESKLRTTEEPIPPKSAVKQ